MNTPIYNRIGQHYDATRQADPYIAKRLAALLGLSPDGRYLDVACGTGNYTSALASHHGGHWDAIDASEKMLTKAQEKPSVRIAWHHTPVEHLPFDPGSFDGAMCTLAIHHFEALYAPFAQVRRILKAGSRFVLLTATPEQMKSYWLVRYFPEAMRASNAFVPTLDHIQQTLTEVGFTRITTEPYQVTPELKDLFLYAGKQRPEMYLSENVRQNISTFSLIAEPEEVATGLEQLRRDIASGEIQTVIEEATSPIGDYMFVVAELH